MNVLLVYPNTVGEGCLPIGLAMIASVLKKARHSVSLFDTSFFDCGNIQERELREKYLEYKKIPNKELKKEKVNIYKEFKEIIVESNPQLITVSCVSSEFSFIKPYLKKIKEEFDIPILIGGIHPTVAPEKTIKEDFVDMICIGEGEEAIVELLDRMSKNKDYTNIKNIWVKKEGKVYRNEVRPLIQDLDSLPFPDWDLFDKKHFKKPFHGEIKKYGFFEFGRGCPYSCSYCINNHLHKLYKGKGNYSREKSVERIVDEILTFKNKFGLEHIQFVDDTFLSMNIEKLRKFTEYYKTKIGRPTMYVMTRPEMINKETVKILKNLGCTMVALGIEHGNEKFRREICKKSVKNSTIIYAFKLLKENGIKVSSFNMIGFPYETRELIFDTIKLNKRVKPNQFTLKPMYPYEGTEIREVCIKENYIEENFEKVEFEETILNMPQISKTELLALRKTAILYVYLPYMVWPLIRICEKENFLSDRLYNLLAKSISV